MLKRQLNVTAGFLLTSFLRDDCGATEMIKKTYTRIHLKAGKHLQFPVSAHQGMEDDQVGDRELQATTNRYEGTRTNAKTIQVDLGRSRAARIAWSEKPEFLKLSRNRSQSYLTSQQL